MKQFKVRITFTEEVLGSAPGDKEIHRRFIAEKAPNAEMADEENAAIQDPEEEFENKLTVFPRNREGKPCAFDYQWKGFFKDACGMLKKVPGSACCAMKAYKKEIDGLLFVFPRLIPFEFEGDIDYCQRPLRGQTPQGERIALASSESLPAGTEMTIEIQLLTDSMQKMVMECLEYGALRGFSQWRNSGKGRFTFTLIDE